jgi:ABC-type multidrug transport system fused ATPase/permease subunit
MKHLLTFYGYCLKKKWSFFSSFIIIAIAVGASVSVKFLVSSIAGAIETNDFSKFQFLIGLILIAFIVEKSANMISRLVIDNYAIYVSKQVRLDVMNKLHDLDFAYHVNKNSGSLISAFKRGDSAIFGMVNELNEGLFRLILEFIILLITFGFIDYRLMAVAFVFSLLHFIFSYIAIQKNLKARSDFNKEDDNLTGIIADNMVNFETVKYFAKEEYEINRLENNLKPWISKLWKYSFSWRFVDLVDAIITPLGVVSTLILSYLLFQEGSLDITKFVLIVTFVISFFPQVSYFVFRIRQISKLLIDFDKYFSILDEEIIVEDPKTNRKLQIEKGKLEFKNITFSYNSKGKIIDGLSLVINPKVTVAFVGESGAGKTTMVKLLFRFYNLDSGSILIDDQDISSITKTSLRSKIGIVPQEPIMFNDTFKFNLTYPNPKISDSEIEKVLKQARLDNVVRNLKDGLETIVGERGIKLSGGQKQRLAIGRAFIENAPIVVFDEATSQLDSESEQLIQEAFWKLAEDKTVIIIAHRLSTILKADRIVVFKDGKVEEIGSHQDLLNKGGYYARLWKIQKGGLIG